MTKVVVTGIGIISSIGNDLQQTYTSLSQKKSGIGKIEILQTIHKNEFLVGEVKHTHEELIKLAEVDPTMAWTRTALLGIIAAKQAIIDSGITVDNNTSLISASTVGGMDRSELFYKDFLDKAEHKEFIDSHHAGNSTEMIAEQCNVGGMISTISTACSSSLNSIMFGARLIKSGKTKNAIVGGTDALSKFTLNGFNTLMILDREHCRPFDSSRTGLNLGEGAAYLILEDLDTALASGKKIYAEVSSYANANDAHHQTASSENGEGPYLSMKNAIDRAGINTNDIDYINAHGTGTENNDLTESIAIKRLFGDNIPPFSSTKAYTGHTLGAAGVIESVFSILALTNELAFPNINFKTSIPETLLKPVEEITKLKNAKHIITNSFGFGGNDSSVIYSKVDSTNKQEKIELKRSKIYINSAATVSPCLPKGNTNTVEEDALKAYVEIDKPNYKDFINPKVLRRMSKIVRMGIVASKTALKEAGLETTDAIITATGMGCQADTEKFLNAMIDNNEGLLTPTSFIQSTHNTVGGAIALGQKNHNYNLTYVHRTFSFESALVDSMMLLNEAKANNILLGGFDEITRESWLIKTKIGFYKKKPISETTVFDDKQTGAQAGEGSSFFVLSNEKTEKSLAELIDTKMFFRPANTDETTNNINEFLIKNNLSSEDIDLVLLGKNGDQEYDKLYKEVSEKLFSTNTLGTFKNICGEYDTASAYATYLATEIIKENRITTSILNKDKYKKKDIKKVLIYNHFRNINHSLILLSKVC